MHKGSSESPDTRPTTAAIYGRAQVTDCYQSPIERHVHQDDRFDQWQSRGQVQERTSHRRDAHVAKSHHVA
jgi:hypothetical protein